MIPSFRIFPSGRGSMKELNCRALDTRDSCAALCPENLSVGVWVNGVWMDMV